LIPDLRQLLVRFVRKVLELCGPAIPILAVVLVAFNLVQDGVNPGQARVPSGVPDNVVRIVSENCRTLKFKSRSFERE
jgi:hypothetical protein